MSDQSSYDLQTMTEMAQRSPTGLQRVGIDYLQARLGGDLIPDALSPMVQLLEIGSTQCALAINEALAADRRRYASFANTPEDLYCVMSDTDYLDRFSGPAQMPLTIMIPYDHVLANMVTDPATGVGRLVLPRYTEVQVKVDYKFTLLYPIEMRMLTSGELQVVYNTDMPSPLQPLTSNTLTWRLQRYPDGKQYLQIDLEILQLERVSSSWTLNDGASLATTLLYDNLYYYARVFSLNRDGSLTELSVTHSEYHHDTRKPTAYLQVDTVAKALTVAIPPIYISNGSVSDQIRVDIYSCQGELSVPMAALNTDQYGMTIGNDPDAPELKRYSGAWGTIPKDVWSVGYIWGGHAELEFETLRRRTIYRATSRETPIMPDQVGSSMEINGYTVTLGNDDLMSRIFYGTRAAPVDPTSAYTTPIPSGVGTIETTLAGAAKLPGSFDNGLRVTLTPKTLFRWHNGVVDILDGSQYPTARAVSQDDLIQMVNDGEYAYTPYHYVMDANSDQLAVRAYYLDAPKLVNRQFLDENQSTQLSVQTTGIVIERVATGWQLTIACKPSANYDDIPQEDVQVQLAFVPAGETTLAYQNGTLLKVDKGMWYWRWQLAGTFDFDANDNVYLQDWSIYDAQKRTLGCALEQEFKFVHTVTNYTIVGMQTAPFDSQIGRFLLDRSAVGVQLESATLQLGLALPNLWCGARTTAGARTYVTYDQDVMAWYDADVYRTFDDGLDFYIEDNEVKREILHHKGDPILNADGTQRIAHAKGTVKEVNGSPIIATARTKACIFDVYLMAGIYYYATAAADLRDAAYQPARIADQYLPALSKILPEAIENTKLFFYPQRTIGPVNILTDNNQSLMLDSGLTVQAAIDLAASNYKSERYRGQVRRIIRNVLTSMLQQETVSMMEVISAIRDTVDSGVKGVSLKLFSGDKELDTFSAGDETYRTNIRRLLAVNDEGKLAVVEDITYDWKLHIPRSDALYTTSEGGRTFTGG